MCIFFVYTSRGALAGARNSLMGALCREGYTQRHIAPRIDALQRS